ncbi:MAG TPA: hypothetical protein VIL55_02065 [Naasia sp.]|jgi:hypothetical protein
MSGDQTGTDPMAEKPSQAEGADPADGSPDHEVLPAEGKPSQAEG